MLVDLQVNLDLLQSIDFGDLDAARQAFVSLVNFDPFVSDDTYLKKIGTALQRTNFYSAKHFAQELTKHCLNSWSLGLRPDHFVKMLQSVCVS